jgi:toluene monooxygenase system protein E
MNPRTYWHLADLRRRPTEYEIGASKLLYHRHRDRGFEVETPVAGWYELHRRAAALQVSDWDAFRDPRQTTYASYTELQRGKESFVDGLVRSSEASRHDERLSPSWMSVLARIIGPLRFPSHGLQMLAAYVAQAAPASPIVIAGAFQAADEMRRVQRLAYRMRELQRIDPAFGATSREAWQTDPMWQPLRELVERLLVTWDWSEALVATSFVLAPRFDELFMTCFGRLARRFGDDLLEKVLFSLGEDCRWHREWTAALVRMAITERPENADVVRGWLEKWDPLATRAVVAFAPLFEDAGESFEEHITTIEATCREQRREALVIREGG